MKNKKLIDITKLKIVEDWLYLKKMLKNEEDSTQKRF